MKRITYDLYLSGKKTGIGIRSDGVAPDGWVLRPFFGGGIDGEYECSGRRTAKYRPVD
jgi:hypothetical protein